MIKAIILTVLLSVLSYSQLIATKSDNPVEQKKADLKNQFSSVYSRIKAGTASDADRDAAIALLMELNGLDDQ